MKEWDLIIEERPEPGSLNMAIDEYLFRSLRPSSHTCVRFYQWARPTVSLGYSQVVEKVISLDSCRQNGVDVVRRMTGGKHVLHHREVTYSVCSSDTGIFSSTLRESYRLISCALIRGLGEMGIEARLAGDAPPSYKKSNLPCFSFPGQNEVEINGRKVIGSAQKREGSRFLQHGSVPLENDVELLRRVTLAGEKLGSLRLISLAEALGKSVDFHWAVERLKQGFELSFGIRFKPRIFSREELDILIALQKKKYASEDWTLHRRGGESVDFFGCR